MWTWRWRSHPSHSCQQCQGHQQQGQQQRLQTAGSKQDQQQAAASSRGQGLYRRRAAIPQQQGAGVAQGASLGLQRLQGGLRRHKGPSVQAQLPPRLSNRLLPPPRQLRPGPTALPGSPSPHQVAAAQVGCSMRLASATWSTPQWRSKPCSTTCQHSTCPPSSEHPGDWLCTVNRAVWSKDTAAMLHDN